MGTLAFLILASYEAVRSPVESLFLERHTSQGLPLAWILVAAVSLVVVVIYNRFAASRPLRVMFLWCTVLTLASLGLCVGARLAGIPGADYALYVWKDVYIVVILEIFWSSANASTGRDQARWVYGAFCVMGSLGSLSGGLMVSAVAEQVGTLTVLLMSVPFLLLAMLMSGALSGAVDRSAEEGPAARGFEVLRKSRYLLLMLAVIATVQVVITLVDYQYNAMLETTFPDTDERTAVGGKVYAAISFGSMALQVLTGPILTLLGIRLTLLGIPFIIGGTVAAFAVAPRFVTMAAAKIAGKCFDYSLFRAAKEILYIPLTYDQKTQGKAFIDMMTYRVAKGGVSVVLFALAQLDILGVLTWLTLALVAAWLFITYMLTGAYEVITKRSPADQR